MGAACGQARPDGRSRSRPKNRTREAGEPPSLARLMGPIDYGQPLVLPRTWFGPSSARPPGVFLEQVASSAIVLSLNSRTPPGG